MSRSDDLFKQAQLVTPGGVNSPVRAFKSVGGTPIFIESALGAYLSDADGKQFIDYVGSWGPMILGHNHPDVVDAITAQLQRGVSYGAPTELEVELAELICKLMPAIERVRMVNSGTEATMTAIRLARGATGRNKILKFNGGYHGHSDSLLVNAGSGALTLGVPSSPGVPADIAQHTLTVDYNNIEAVSDVFTKYGKDIAAIIVEPVAGNCGCVLPEPDFLPGLRTLCDEYESILIFDEVMTGFRVALGGAQQRFDVTPDLTTLGKIIGGGLPVGALGGKQSIMSQLAPEGPVYQAGTLSGNPLAMAAGLATLRAITETDFYANLDSITRQLLEGLEAKARDANIDLQTTQAGSMFGLRFGQDIDVKPFNVFFHEMLKCGIYFGPSAYESGFVSAAHGLDEIETTINAAEQSFANMQTFAN